jgi:hypothetical protein
MGRRQSGRGQRALVAVLVFHRRQSFGGRTDPDKLWDTPQRFFIPAWELPLKELEDMGAALLKRGLRPAPGPAPAGGALSACSLFPEDAVQAAEFVVLTIEAERRDKLKRIEFKIEASAPELWLLPFAGEGLALEG